MVTFARAKHNISYLKIDKLLSLESRKPHIFNYEMQGSGFWQHENFKIDELKITSRLQNRTLNKLPDYSLFVT